MCFLIVLGWVFPGGSPPTLAQGPHPPPGGLQKWLSRMYTIPHTVGRVVKMPTGRSHHQLTIWFSFLPCIHLGALVAGLLISG